MVVMGTESGGGVCTNSGIIEGCVVCFSVPAPSAFFAENVEPFASSVAVVVMSAFVRHVRILALVQLGV